MSLVVAKKYNQTHSKRHKVVILIGVFLISLAISIVEYACFSNEIVEVFQASGWSLIIVYSVAILYQAPMVGTLMALSNIVSLPFMLQCKYKRVEVNILRIISCVFNCLPNIFVLFLYLTEAVNFFDCLILIYVTLIYVFIFILVSVIIEHLFKSE